MSESDDSNDSKLVIRELSALFTRVMETDRTAAIESRIKTEILLTSHEKAMESVTKLLTDHEKRIRMLERLVGYGSAVVATTMFFMKAFKLI